MLPRASIKEITLWLLRRRRRFRVQGYSMEPVLHEGCEVLVKSIRKPLSTTGQSKKHAHLCDRTNVRAGNRLREGISQGNLVVAEHPERPRFLVIKQWDGESLKSLCHKECGVEVGRVLGVVTSIF